MKPQRTDDFVKKLKRDYGLTLDRQNGSHMILTNNKGLSVSVPNKREIAPGTQRQVLTVINQKNH